MSALNIESEVIAVVLGGTPVPLPDEHHMVGFTANANNTIFTVANTGTYFISYNITLASALLTSSQILLNGAPLAGTNIEPVVSISNFSATVIRPLNAGDTLVLELFGILGSAVLHGGAGASLTVIRLS